MFTRSLALTLSASLAVILCLSAAAEATIVSVQLANSGDGPNAAQIVNNGFDEDVDAFTDRTHEWNSAGGHPTIAELGLTGADYIKFPNDDKNVSNFTATITMGPGLHDLYLLWDTRNSINSWVTSLGFVNTGDDIGVDESGDGDIDNTSHVLKLEGFAGNQVVLLEENQHNGNMYGFAAQESVIPEPSTLLIWSLLAGLGIGVGWWRRKR